MLEHGCPHSYLHFLAFLTTSSPPPHPKAPSLRGQCSSSVSCSHRRLLSSSLPCHKALAMTSRGGVSYTALSPHRQPQLTSAEKSPWCRSSKVSPDLVEYGISWSPRCRAITVTCSEKSVLELSGVT